MNCWIIFHLHSSHPESSLKRKFQMNYRMNLCLLWGEVGQTKICLKTLLMSFKMRITILTGSQSAVLRTMKQISVKLLALCDPKSRL
jgi:hypothetical protein